MAIRVHHVDRTGTPVEDTVQLTDPTEIPATSHHSTESSQQSPLDLLLRDLDDSSVESFQEPIDDDRIIVAAPLDSFQDPRRLFPPAQAGAFPVVRHGEDFAIGGMGTGD